MISSPGSATASTAFMNAMFPPAVTTTRLFERSSPFSRVSFVSSAPTSSGSPSTGPYWCAPRDERNRGIASVASGGGPYATIPCPSEMVPGVCRIHSPRIGMMGACTAAMRRDIRGIVINSQSPTSNTQSGPSASLGIGNWELEVGSWELGVGSWDTSDPRSALRQDRLKHPERAVFPDLVPLEMRAVHRNVDARRQHLDERQGAAEIEQSIRASERIGHHRAGKDDGFPGHVARKMCGG